MNASPTPPSRRLRGVALFASALWWLALAAWLAFLLAWGALHGLIVPRIEKLRPWLEQQASRQLGVELHIGSLRAEADSWRHLPTIEVRDVEARNAQGEPVLSLARARGTLSPRSLLRLGFEQLVLDRLQLDAVRHADGHIELAGMALDTGDSASGSAAAEWVFRQRELVLRDGELRWRDELAATSAPGAAAPTQVFRQVLLVLRNEGLSHAWRLDVEPPQDWGRRLHLVGQVRQSVFSLHRGDWRRWSGTLFADADAIDLSRLAALAGTLPGPLALQAGQGHVRGWGELAQGALQQATLDLALHDVVLHGHASEPMPAALALSQLGGRVSWQALPRGLAVQTEALQFQLADGPRWSGGNVQLHYQDAGWLAPAEGALQAQELDLGALAEVARRLPLPAAWQRQLAAYAPQGRVRHIEASWRGGSGSGSENGFGGWAWQLRGRVEQLALTPGAADAGPGRPGVRGATVEVDLDQQGGRADLSIAEGELSFPGVFEEPRIALDRLQARVDWQQRGGSQRVEVSNLSFANADAAGQATASWSAEPDANGHMQLPGRLQLHGQLSRAEGTRVYRYLPLEIPAMTRHYVRDAVRAGRASQVDFDVDSALDHFPPGQGQQGVFRIDAALQDVDFDYVPPALLGDGDASVAGEHWPALAGVSAQLVFDRHSMQVRHASGRFNGLRQLRLSQASADIDELGHDQPLLRIEGQVSGPVEQALDFIRRSPLNRLAGSAFSETRGRGDSRTQLALRIPLLDAEHTRVEGRSVLHQAGLQSAPQIPWLEQIEAQVDFTETGFSVAQAHAQLLGGALQFGGQGHSQTDALGRITGFQAGFEGQGQLSAEGLRQARELPLLARLGQAFDGQADYRMHLGWVDGHLQARFDSDLNGFASRLPAPLNKSATTALPTRFEARLVGPMQDQISLHIGERINVAFERDLSGSYPRVLRGAVQIDDQQAPEATLPAAGGVLLGLQLDRLDLQAWQPWLTVPSATATKTAAVDDAGQTAAEPDVDAALAGFLPTRLTLRVGELSWGARRLHRLQALGQREQSRWKIELDADEAQGRMDYDADANGPAGRLVARLDRLSVERADASVADTEAGAASGTSIASSQPETLPALDIDVARLQVAGKELGRLQLLASNHALPRPAAADERESEREGEGEGKGEAQEMGHGTQFAVAHEWQLDRLSLTTPEATLTARGRWRFPSGHADVLGVSRQTDLNFTLETRDVGALLTRLGYIDLFRQGHGELAGQVSWIGSPVALDYPSLSGTLHLDVRDGQFLKADPGPARLLGVLSLQALPRRLTLDFRDAFAEGFAFDFVRGDVDIRHGLAHTNNLQMKGVSAAVLMEGQVDLVDESQNLNVVVVPELNTVTMALLATAINPAVGIGTFVAQWLLKRPLLNSVTRTFRIRGSWSDPDIMPVSHVPQVSESRPTVPESQTTEFPH